MQYETSPTQPSCVIRTARGQAPQWRPRCRLSSVCNGFCSVHAWQAGGSRRKPRTTPKDRQAKVETPSLCFPYRIMLIPYGLFTRRQRGYSHDLRHRPIDSARPVQGATKSLTRVWAKICFGTHSGDQYITMQRLEFHILTPTELHGRAAPRDETGFSWLWLCVDLWGH